MVMQWGQFVDHDITNTAKKSYDCCHPSIRYTILKDSNSVVILVLVLEINNKLSIELIKLKCH